MPKYSYKCKDCQKQFIAFHKISEKKDRCDCGSPNVQKVISSIILANDSDNSPVGIHLKDVIDENKQLLDAYKQELRGK